MPDAPCARLPGSGTNAASLSYSGMRLSRSPELMPVTMDSRTCSGVAVDMAVSPFGIHCCVTEWRPYLLLGDMARLMTRL